MITTDNKLQVFENFIVDMKLKKTINDNTNVITNNISNSIFTNNPSGFIFSGSDGVTIPNGFIRRSDEFALVTEYRQYVYSQNSTIINWLKLIIAKIFMSNRVNRSVCKYQSIENFFIEIHNQIKNLNLDENSIDFYISAIENANKNGQQALVDILASKKNVLLRELQLLKNSKIVQYVDEADVVNFFKKTKSSSNFLKLTWIKNYVRVIPTDVLEKKNLFDNNECFDNYVILHFDLNNDSTQLTEKEKEKAKDPILFGLISGSRKLYFIGDWIDEYCDLTLDKLIKTLEQKKIKELNDINIKKDFGM